MAESRSLVCVGFGVAGLSLAVALLDRQPSLDILFLEQQSAETWSPTDDTPVNSDTTTNFLNDLVTLENPRSQYTFIKFLHEKKWLVNFTNVGKTHTSRRLRGEYLKWVSNKLEQYVRYSTQVSGVELQRIEKGGPISSWTVTARDISKGNSIQVECDHVVLAVGHQPKIPRQLAPALTQGRLIHASQSQARLRELTARLGQPINVAIIGKGQQAAEIFDNMYQSYGPINTTWYIRNVDEATESRKLYDNKQILPLELQSRNSLEELESTGMLGEVDDALFKSIAEHQYAQSITHSDSSSWRWRIETNRQIRSAETSPDGRLRLLLGDDQLTNIHSEGYDLVIVASGFERTTCKQLLRPVRDMYDGPELSVDSKYRVNLRRGATQDGIGIWSVGSLEVPKSAGEDVFPILAARSKRVADAIVEAQSVPRSLTSFTRKRIQAQI